MSPQPQDPVDQLESELIALRRSVEHLSRTSLDKEEAEALHDTLAQSVDRLIAAGPEMQRTMDERLARGVDMIHRDAITAAAKAARDAIVQSHEESRTAARNLSKAAGEARKEAWRHFGGFWVWLTSMLATGVAVGALATIFLLDARTAYDFGDHPDRYCGLAGGQEGENDNGRGYCVFWYE